MAAAAAFISYLIIGVAQVSAFVALPIAIAVLVVLYLVMTKVWGLKEEAT